MKSMKENKNSSSKYKIFVLAEKVDEDNVKLLNSLNGDNFEVNIINAENSLENINSANKVVSNSAYLKFVIPKLFQQYKKILYIDVDTIVLKDLSSLYNVDLGQTYAGVVFDYCVSQYENREKLFNLKQYFNSGIMLLNTDKILQDGLVEKLIDWVKNNAHKYRFKDQDAFNVCFNNNITPIEPQYNFFSSLAYYNKKDYLKFYNIKESDININNIAILHYAWKKPWLYKGLKCEEYWHKYYNSLNNAKELTLKSCTLVLIYVIIRNNLRLIKELDKIIRRRTKKTI